MSHPSRQTFRSCTPSFKMFSTLAVIGVCTVGAAIAVPQQPPQQSPPQLPLAPPATPPPPTDPPADRPKVVLAEGQVLNFIGGGEAGAKITLARKKADGTPGEELSTATSDNMGDFKLMGSEPLKGPAVVRIEKKGYAIIVKDVSLGEGEYPPFVDAELAGMFVVQGKVTDARNGQSIAGAHLTLRSAYREWEQSTNEKGAFRFDGLFPGEMELIVEAVGFGREATKTEIGPDGNEVNVALKPERTARIRTVDTDGKPVANVVLECYDAERDDFRTVASDASGWAVVRGIHYDAKGFKIRATHPDYIADAGMERVIEFPAESAQSEHELRLSPGARIGGQVIDAATRKPLADTRVIAGALINDAAPQSFTDLDGRFMIRGIPPGKITVTAYRSGFAPEMTQVDASAGTEREANLALGAPRAVSGVVLDHSDKPSPRAMVQTHAWRGQDTLSLRAMTDDQGRFVLQDAPRDAFDLVATSRDGAEGKAPVGPEAKDVVITLSKPRESSGGRAAPRIAVGAVAPDATVKTLDGKELKISGLRGKTVFLDFWATWCGPCVAEVPNVVKVFETFGQREDFVMISVSLDRDEQALRKFIESRKMNWRHVFGDEAGATAAANAYGVEGIPSMFLIGPDGKIAAVELRGPAIVDEVTKLLAKPKS